MIFRINEGKRQSGAQRKMSFGNHYLLESNKEDVPNEERSVATAALC
jgi:hypothetical protein